MAPDGDVLPLPTGVAVGALLTVGAEAPDAGAACAALNRASSCFSAPVTTVAEASMGTKPEVPDKAMCQRPPVACATNKAVHGGAALPAGTGITVVPKTHDRSALVRVICTTGLPITSVP